MRTVLLAEDDDAIAAPLSRALEREGYDVQVASTGDDALRQMLGGTWDLLLLDLGLPGMDGLEVCRQIRTHGIDIPVLMLTARTDEVDFVVGLDAGADDYVGKPFRLAELLARVRALMRRRGGSADEPSIEIGDIYLDKPARRVTRNGKELTLANKEYELLKLLMERAGEVVPRDEIQREVWGDVDLRGSKTLDMHMSWLRRKIGDEGRELGRRISTVRGVGFRFNAE
ncbi:response regulator transcription factor [Hoyosella rhizosphaerae]|uniref:DNA-binding response regulator n=1 Tax=Hoyosella rhizosphaerae TaxID=1755582 RepID=A0A916XEL1_9ACTN|nr:response regulator transcription factor [Hoyosella rhizosphaerae]MBN4926028.1 response regulator transcription factor [Hoyosella rhizosphaerae]GGC66119.1 DNA-binding response regulator [Hoyosella rhizosphaerae]